MNAVAYEVERLGAERVMVYPPSRRDLGEVDSVVFDCDGVLIDVSGSYDSVIVKTAASMVRGFTGRRLDLGRAGGDAILKIRRTGGFNDDWDTTYALTMFLVLAIDGEMARGVPPKFERVVEAFSSRMRLDGKKSVDRFLEREGLESDLTQRLREYIDSEVDPAHNRLSRTFDEMYYGRRLFRRVYREDPLVWQGEGLIEREKMLIDGEALNRLKKVLGGGRMAMATGRPFVAVQYTLGKLLRYFDTDASVYIGDAEVDPSLAPELRPFRKPSGASLLRAYRMLSSKKLLYVGDSAEDRLMVRDARKTLEDVFFGGIYGTSFDQAGQMEYFTKNGADLVTRAVTSVPMILEKMRA